MKRQFSGYYRPTKEEFKELWDKCLFVLDANVLLGLYRYPRNACDDLILVLKKISDRVWIPHQVALEYQKNRLGVITEQIGKYSEVTRIISDVKGTLTEKMNALQLKRRHSSIDPDDFLARIDSAITEFEQKLDALKQKHPGITDEDSVREQVDTLFNGKIGNPLSADDLEKLYTSGKTRYELGRPPGYLDKGKSNEVYLYNDLVLRREYGDLIIWQQIINESIARKISHLVFVTDDEKEDWWWVHSGRTLGPRPELVEEISEKAGVSMFYMYSPSRFLEFAKDFLGIHVKPESINQVDEISKIAAEQRIRISRLLDRGASAERAVYNWLQRSYADREIIVNSRVFPDFLVRSDSETIGFEVKYVHEPRTLIHRWQEPAYRGYYDISKGKINAFSLVLVVDDSSKVDDVTSVLRRSSMALPEMVRVITGIIVQEEQVDAIFKPLKSTHFGGEIT